MSSSSSSRARTQRYRESLRRKGMRPVQIWVPDVNAPGFADEVKRQCERINQSAATEGTLDWIESVSLFDNEDRA